MRNLAPASERLRKPRDFGRACDFAARTAVCANACACVGFAVSRLRSQFARLAKDTAIVGLPLNRGAEECLPNRKYSLPSRLILFPAQRRRRMRRPSIALRCLLTRLATGTCTDVEEVKSWPTERSI